jgi:anti-sigma factor RsiW
MGKRSSLPMKCTEVHKHLSAFEDGELSSALRSDIESHLATCSDCQQSRDNLHRLWFALEDSPVPQPRPDLSQEIMRKITEQSGQRRLDRMRFLEQMIPRPAALAAMVVLGLLVGGWMGKAVMINPASRVMGLEQNTLLDGLDVFTPTPRGSLAQGYLVLISDATQVK